MKTIVLVGLLSLLLIIAYDTVTGAPGKSTRPAGQPVSVSAPVALARNGELPVVICEYVFLHQAHRESLAFHAMSGVTACP